MNDVASSGAGLQLSLLEAVSDALGLALFVCDRNDEIIFASRPIQQFYPVDARFLAPGKRLRDFLGAVFDLGFRSGTANEQSRRRVNRDEWISERVSLHWRERYDTVERIARQRWISIRKRRLANGLCVVSISEISEQRKKEEQIRLDLERVELTEGILDGLPNPICVKDRSLNYIAVNKAFCSLHGMTAEQILGRSVWDLIEPGLAEKFEKSDRMVLDSGREYSLPQQMVKANGDDCWVVTHKFRVGDAQRSLLVTCMNDVTDVVIGFDENGVAPELAAQMSVKDYAAFEPAQNCHDPYQALDLHVLAHTAPLPQPSPLHRASASAASTTSSPGRVVLVTADPKREEMCLTPLAQAGHEVCALRSADELEVFLIAIQDVGLSVDVVLLDPPVVMTQSASRPGIVPLLIRPDWTAQQLVAAVEQHLDTRRADTGSPKAVLGPAIGTPADWDIVVPQSQRSSFDIDVLVAEDNEINQFVFSQILEGLGLSYKIAANGEEAVRLWQQMNPRMILMDVSMPVMNGFDATRAIRAAEATLSTRTPIIAVTTQALDIDLEQTRVAGMDDHIVKPISPDMIERVYAHHSKERPDQRHHG
jgi:PAS domain S-box-containing protein